MATRRKDSPPTTAKESCLQDAVVISGIEKLLSSLTEDKIKGRLQYLYGKFGKILGIIYPHNSNKDEALIVYDNNQGIDDLVEITRIYQTRRYNENVKEHPQSHPEYSDNQKESASGGNYKEVDEARDELFKDFQSKTKSSTSNEDRFDQASGDVKDSRQSNTELLQVSKINLEFVMEIFQDELEKLKKKYNFGIIVKNISTNNTVGIMLHPNDKKTFLFNEATETFSIFFQSKNKNIRHGIVKITEDLSERQLDDAISTAKQTYPKMLFQRNESLTEVTIVGYVAKVAGYVDQVEKAHDLLCETLNGFSHGSSSTRNKPNAHITMNSGTIPTAKSKQENNEDKCPICLDYFECKTSLEKCNHFFCKECIYKAIKLKSACPVCQTVYGKLKGDQPKDASMKVTTYYTTLPGTTEIHYDVPSGRQGSEHPHPGKPYHGTTRTAYLPASPEGRHVLGLLRRAFDQRLIFTIGTSSTTELHDCVTWNDIQHKTSTHEGPDSYGYPDRDYLKRVQEQLKAKGIF